MPDIIKVSTSKLTSTANSFQATGNQIKSITTQMTTLVNSLNGSVWSDEAASAYKKKFGQLQDDINRMIKMVNEHVTDLNEMAREYENAAATIVTDEELEKQEKANQELFEDELYNNLEGKEENLLYEDIYNNNENILD